MHKRGWDWLLFMAILAIGAISLLVIFALDKNLAQTQLIFWFIGLVIFFLISNVDFQIWQKLAVPFYILTLILLGLVLLFGEPIRGSVRWIDLGILRFQPSEIAKVATILILAVFFKERGASGFFRLLSSLVIITLPVILIVLEPDIGNTLAFFAIWLGIVVISGFDLRKLLAVLLIIVLGAIFALRFLAPYQKARIESFLNPTSDPLGTGYSLIQSKIAVGSGMFFGRGLGRGSQTQLRFLPEPESDFIFASVSEQLGFIGASLLLILFGFFFIRINSSVTVSRFGQLVIVGTISYLSLQLLVNIGMNMGMVPVTGITLPLVSYGGSSLISTLFLLGIVFSIKRYAVE